MSAEDPVWVNAASSADALYGSNEAKPIGALSFSAAPVSIVLCSHRRASQHRRSLLRYAVLLPSVVVRTTAQPGPCGRTRSGREAMRAAVVSGLRGCCYRRCMPSSRQGLPQGLPWALCLGLTLRRAFLRYAHVQELGAAPERHAESITEVP